MISQEMKEYISEDFFLNKSNQEILIELKNFKEEEFIYALYSLLYNNSVELNTYIYKNLDLKNERKVKLLNYVAEKGLSSDKYLCLFSLIDSISMADFYNLVVELNEIECYELIDKTINSDMFKKEIINITNKREFIDLLSILIEQYKKLNITKLFTKNKIISKILLEEKKEIIYTVGQECYNGFYQTILAEKIKEF
jgi:hypothetical protein